MVVGNAWKNWVLIALDCDTGETGFGEATLGVSTLPVTGALEELRPIVLGEDPLRVDALWTRMRQAWNLPADRVHIAAMSAVEIACWDLIGKSVGQPLHALLGGAVRERIPVYANGWYGGDRTPEGYAKRAAATVELGYRALKLDPFGDAAGGLSRSEERMARTIVAAVREAIGPDVKLMIEAHDRFDVADAQAIAIWLAPFDVTWLEAPVHSEDIARLGQVARRSPVPIAAGERLTQSFQFDDLWRRGRVRIWQPETLGIGGVSGMRRIAALAATYGAAVAPHNARGPVCTAVNVALAAWLPGLLVLETFVSESIPLARAVAPSLPEVVDGFVKPSNRPGLGIDLDEDVIRAHPFNRNSVLRLFEPGWESRRGARRGAKQGRRRAQLGDRSGGRQLEEEHDAR
jgi:galactonate dehydratase